MNFMPPGMFETDYAEAGATTKRALKLVESVSALEHRHEAAMNFLGSIICTLTSDFNRDRLLEGDQGSIKTLIKISDGWAEKFKMMKATHVTVRKETT